MVLTLDEIKMILKFADYKDGIPKSVEMSYDPKILDLDFVDSHFIQPIALTGTVEKNQQTATFQGELTSQIEQVCARCLDKIQNYVKAPFDLSYDISGRETIDTTNDMRDILILSHPERFLCRTDCKGICARCGVNLNRETCHCKKNEQLSEHQVTQFEILKSKFKKKDS